MKYRLKLIQTTHISFLIDLNGNLAPFVKEGSFSSPVSGDPFTVEITSGGYDTYNWGYIGDIEYFDNVKVYCPEMSELVSGYYSLPSDYVGYDITDCDTSANPLPLNECSVTCDEASGYFSTH